MMDSPPAAIAALSDADSRFIRAGDVLVHYKLAHPSSTAGPTKRIILLEHGFLATLNTWSAILQSLADRTACTVLAYDRVGFGLTERPDKWPEGEGGNPYTIEHARHLPLRLLSALKFRTRDLILVGNSAGGAQAVHTFLAHEERSDFRALVLISAAIKVATPPSFVLWLMNTTPMRLLWRQLLPRNIPFKAGYADPGLARRDDIVRAYRTQLAAPGFWDAFFRLVAHARFEDLSGRLRELAGVEVLILTGDKDGIINPSDTRKVADELTAIKEQAKGKRCAFVELEKVGHAPQEEAPEKLLDVLVEFISAISE